ncbi:MAG: GNAT family N-acetyltransferase [Dokdonella sp.]|uniref:GNAT family N-acetyltransferase n=1 Tax=Dokdonella sp. TaxID=2291710 RepID=UPI00326411B2
MIAVPTDLEIRPLGASADLCVELADLLVEVVARNGSVSFMHPLAPEVARAFWERALAAADRGERIVLGAWLDGVLAGTVSLLLDFPPNQPHRGEIAKLMTRPDLRGRGIAAALVREAERVAIEHRRTLLVLDTATDGGASTLYESLGFTLTGEIPDFALTPHGVLTGTRIYWKRIGARPSHSGVDR